jgi:hypothetical protein
MEPSTARSRTRRRLLGTVGIAALGALAGCSVSTGDRTRRTATEQFTVDGDSVDRLVVRGDDGETTVRSHDGADVAVEATTFAVGRTELSAVTVVRELDAGRLTLGVEVDAGVSFGVSGGGLERLDVRVPREVAVERVETDDGTARVTGVAGDPVLAVDDGSLEADDIEGAVEARVDDGQVRLGTVGAVAGELDDGSLRMTDGATLGNVTADDGELRLAATALEGDPTVEIDDGSVELALASTLDAAVEVRADDGSVRVDDGVLRRVETSDGVTRGAIGDASAARLTVRVDDGDVRIRPLG